MTHDSWHVGHGYYWPMTYVTHPDLLTHFTHDPLTHCQVWYTLLIIVSAVRYERLLSLTVLTVRGCNILGYRSMYIECLSLVFSGNKQRRQDSGITALLKNRSVSTSLRYSSMSMRALISDSLLSLSGNMMFMALLWSDSSASGQAGMPNRACGILQNWAYHWLGNRSTASHQFQRQHVSGTSRVQFCVLVWVIRPCSNSLQKLRIKWPFASQKTTFCKLNIVLSNKPTELILYATPTMKSSR